MSYSEVCNFDDWRENVALFLVRYLHNDENKEKTKYFWNEITKQAYGENESKHQVTETNLCLDIRNKNALFTQESYHQFHSEKDYESEDLLSSMNQLKLILKGSCTNLRSNSFQFDSGYNTEEFKNVVKDSNGYENIKLLVEKIYCGLIRATTKYLYGIDDKCIEEGINLIKRTISANSEVVDSCILLLMTEIEEMLQNNNEKGYQKEKVFIIIKEICRGNDEITIPLIEFLLKNTTEMITEKISTNFVFHDYNNLFYILNTMSALLTDFEFNLKTKLENNTTVSSDKITIINCKRSSKRMYLSFKKINKKIDKIIQFSENHCHLGQVLFMLRKSSLIICNVLRLFNKTCN